MNDGHRTSFLDSAMDALSPQTLFIRLWSILFFGAITAAPYLISNLNNVWNSVVVNQLSGFWIFWAYLKAIMLSVEFGILIGLSTVFDSFLRLGSVIGNVEIGTILYSLFVLIFATLTFYQPISVIFNIMDFEKGQVHSKVFIMSTSFLLVALLLSPLSYVIISGETLTSGISNSFFDKVADGIADIPQNSTNSTVSSINLTEKSDSSYLIDMIS